MSTSTDSKIAALRRLGGIYANAALFHREPRRIPTGGDPSILTDVLSEVRENYRATRAARQQLLYSGYAVPERWLTVSAEPGVKIEYDPEPTIIISSLDVKELVTVGREIDAAIMRLESPISDVARAHKGDSQQRPAAPSPEDRERLVSEEIRRQLDAGTPASVITRDKIAAALGIAAGSVSGTNAWAAHSARKQQEMAKDRPAEFAESDVNAAIERGDWDAVLKAQQKEQSRPAKKFK